ncbi:MAG TPA: hypothetical protein DCF62_00890 [Porticoccaceae bacterium]|nr:hypothetical protein [Porticoccaceae bacterium]HCO58668.1 hypothetical protein [Porticoccaceae bacterium]
MESVDFFPIDIEQTSWSTSAKELSHIRHQVFVKEQGVTEEEEFDEADTSAVHWIAYGPGRRSPDKQEQQDSVIGCARLVGNKVGRMAVVHTRRNQGVGSALMRRIIRYAARNGLDTLELNAQSHAVDFYRGMYFEVEGEEFMDAGIPHRHMVLSLKRFIEPKVTPPPPDVSEEQRQRVPLESADAFRNGALKLAAEAQRQIRIFSPELDPRIYDNETFHRLLFDFARTHPHAEIHILVCSPKLLVQNSHRLLRLYHNLPSRMQMKVLNPRIRSLHNEYMVVDHTGILYKQGHDRYTGYLVHHAPLEATDLADTFDDMWHHSEPDPELRKLPI